MKVHNSSFDSVLRYVILSCVVRPTNNNMSFIVTLYTGLFIEYIVSDGEKCSHPSEIFSIFQKWTDAFFCNKYFIGQFKNLDRTNTQVIYRGTTVHSHTEMRGKSHTQTLQTCTDTLTHTSPTWWFINIFCFMSFPVLCWTHTYHHH